MSPLKKLRGLLAIGLIWGILWAAVAMTIGTIIGILDPDDIDPSEEPIVLAPIIAGVGFICGVVFLTLAYTAERGKPILQVPLIRVAMWGMLVSAALPLVSGKGIPEMLITVPLDAVCAMASVAIMRTWAGPPATR